METMETIEGHLRDPHCVSVTKSESLRAIAVVGRFVRNGSAHSSKTAASPVSFLCHLLVSVILCKDQFSCITAQSQHLVHLRFTHS